MRGTSPVSAGASAQLAQLIAAIGQDPRAQKLLESEDDPGRVLEALRSLDRDAGAAVSAYLDLVGYRLLDGFDICEPLRARAAGRAVPGDSRRGRRRDERRRRSDVEGADRGRPREGSRAASGRSSTSCSGRLG